jgi:hypothetical protein
MARLDEHFLILSCRERKRYTPDLIRLDHPLQKTKKNYPSTSKKLAPLEE